MEREVGGGSGWGTHVNPWLIHVNLGQNPLQCCEVISLQLIKINGKKIFLKSSLLKYLGLQSVSSSVVGETVQLQFMEQGAKS